MIDPVTVHGSGIPWQRRYREAIAAGLRSAGHQVRESAMNDYVEGTHILLGPNSWHSITAKLEARGEDYITVNRAFVGSVLGHETNPYVAIGWNGFNNRARFPFEFSDVEAKRLPHSRADPLWRFVEPVSQESGGPMLILGEYDDFPVYFRQALADCGRHDLPAWFRPHPNGRTPARATSCPAKSLAAACRQSRMVLTHHSTAACEALLRGVPVIAYDEESMCWPIAQQAPVNTFDPSLPDRGPWIEWLAWTQWTIDEITRGDPWEWF